MYARTHETKVPVEQHIILPHGVLGHIVKPGRSPCMATATTHRPVVLLLSIIALRRKVCDTKIAGQQRLTLQEACSAGTAVKVALFQQCVKSTTRLMPSVN